MSIHQASRPWRTLEPATHAGSSRSRLSGLPQIWPRFYPICSTTRARTTRLAFSPSSLCTFYTTCFERAQYVSGDLREPAIFGLYSWVPGPLRPLDLPSGISRPLGSQRVGAKFRSVSALRPETQRPGGAVPTWLSRPSRPVPIEG
jgi:hypothetical protein